MSLIQIDLVSWLPDSLKQQIIDSVVTFVADWAQKALGDEASQVLRRLRSDTAFQDEVDRGLKEATDRFVREYTVEDEDLVAAIARDPDFWKAESVREALLKIVRHPGVHLTEEQTALVRSFADVLHQRVNRERVDRAVTFYLHCVAEALWHLPQIQPLYELQMQRLSVERATEMVRELRGMRADVKEVMVALVQVIDERQKLTTSEKLALPEPKKVYHNLPQPDYGRFIGREKALAQVHSILRPYPHSQYPIVIIDGIGGIGKSALALEVAHRYLRDYYRLPEEERFEAVIWTSAKSSVLTANGIVPRQQITRTLDDIYAIIAVTLEREDITRARLEEQDELVRRALTRQRTLLIVDNLETVDDERVNAFLRELPAPTKAIVTTRHRIDVAYPLRLTGMLKEDGLLLIAQECIRKGVTLAAAEAEKLYDRTGGVPLAIVWSVAQMGYGYSVEAVLRRLGQPTEDISRFCFESGVNLIQGTDAHKLLMALSLFATDASRETLGYVAGLGADYLSRDEGLIQLEKLSLINKFQDRFSLLPLTKEYALARLEAEPAFQREAQDRLIEYYVDLVTRYPRSDFRSHPLFEIELANILHLLDLCHHSGRNKVVAQIMLGLDVFLWARGYWNEALDHLRAVLAYAEKEGDLDLQAHANRALGRIHLYHCEYEVAKRYLENACQQYKHVGNVREAVSSACYLSLVYADRGDLADARRLLEDNLQLALSAEDYETIIRLQNTLAEIEIEEGNFIKALKRIRGVLELEEAEFQASTVGIGWAYLIAGKLAMHDKDFGKARDFFARSLSIACNRGIKQDIGYAKMYIASLLGEEGKLQEAVEMAQDAFKIFSKIGDVQGTEKARWLISKLSVGWKAPIIKRWARVSETVLGEPCLSY